MRARMREEGVLKSQQFFERNTNNLPGYLGRVPLPEGDCLPAADDGGPARPQAEAELGHARPEPKGYEVAATVARELVLGRVENKA